MKFKSKISSYRWLTSSTQTEAINQYKKSFIEILLQSLFDILSKASLQLLFVVLLFSYSGTKLTTTTKKKKHFFSSFLSFLLTFLHSVTVIILPLLSHSSHFFCFLRPPALFFTYFHFCLFTDTKKRQKKKKKNKPNDTNNTCNNFHRFG